MFAFSYLLPLSNYLQCLLSPVKYLSFILQSNILGKPTKNLYLLSAMEL